MTSTISLKDGRVLAYAEYGDPNGKPLFFFHGAPGSRLFCPPETITSQMGVRLICVDRPGYGGSTFQPNRRLLDWADDVLALADSKKLDKFSIAGHSGGGPHTLACAYKLTDRINTVAIISGAGPVNAPSATDGMTPLNRFAFTYGQYIPWVVAYAIMWWFYHDEVSDPTIRIDKDRKTRHPAEQAILDIPEVRETCMKSDVEGYRQGLRGFAWDVRLITHPWGFPLDKIRVPVFLWHGTADEFTSVTMGRYMANIIPNCKATFCEGETHMLLIPHWEEILSTLIHP